MLFIVERKEIWAQNLTVEAESLEEAIKKVQDGDGEIIENQFEYCRTLNSDTWNVYAQERR
jgi:hypothetical protein